MTHIPLQAKVECVDGACGESITVVVNPTTQSVTHFVVKDKSLPDPNERLVPVDQVEEVSPQMIRLRCTKSELAELESFIETQYIKTEQPSLAYSQYDSYMFPYVTNVETTELPVEVERVPPGGLAIHRGTLVEATDGFVGEVGELVVDPQSSHVTHFVLREGHLWGKKEDHAAAVDNRLRRFRYGLSQAGQRGSGIAAGDPSEAQLHSRRGSGCVDGQGLR